MLSEVRDGATTTTLELEGGVITSGLYAKRFYRI